MYLCNLDARPTRYIGIPIIVHSSKEHPNVMIESSNILMMQQIQSTQTRPLYDY